nr:glycosyltransferase [Sagittula marina]
MHLCLSCFYIDDWSYQENELVRQHVKDGHDVLVIASTETYDAKAQMIYCSPCEYMGSDGARVIRLPYHRLLPHKIMRKLRVYEGVYEAIKAFAPDTILFHGAGAYEINTVARYARNHPEVPLYVDSHTDFSNSAQGFVAREVLHKLYYRQCLQAALPEIDKLLGVTPERCDFLHDVYGVPKDRIELFPMGGHPVHDPDYAARRNRTRAALSLSADTIAFAYTGKMRLRRKPIETLTAFIEHAPPDSVLLIGGILLDGHEKARLETLIASDPRIRFLGWQQPEQLTDLLCATDVYLNPGTHSSTNEQAVCCRCAFALNDAPVSRALLSDSGENGWFLNSKTSLADVFCATFNADIQQMKALSYNLACQNLDYAMLAKRVLFRPE